MEIFSTNLAYLSLKADTGVENTFKGAWIWKLDSIPKIKNFFWLCMHNSAPVRGVLANRVLIATLSAPFAETRMRLLTIY